VLGPKHLDVVLATSRLGRNRYELGRRAEAEATLRAARWRSATVSPIRGRRSRWRTVVTLYEGWGKGDRAAEYRRRRP